MTTLHEACRRGDQNLVAFLLSRKDVNVNELDEEGATPLMCATEHLSVVQLLHQNGADLSLEDSSGRTVIHVATYRGHFAVIQWLLENQFQLTQTTSSGTDRGLVDRLDHQRETALHYAVYRGDMHIVKYLVEVAGSNVAARNRRGKTALNLARQANDIPLMEYLQSLHNLAEACIHGDSIKLMQLCQSGVFCKVRIGRHGEQPIHVACQNGEWQTVLNLHEYGFVDLDVECSFGLTPLHYACKGGHEKIVRWLCEKGVDVDKSAAKSEGLTPLGIAVSCGQFNATKVLLEFGVNVNHSFGSSELSPIFVASEEGHLQVVRLLLENNAIMQRDISGSLPIHAACRGGHVKTTELLLAFCDYQVEIDDWVKAVQLASEQGHFEIVIVFLVSRITSLA